MDFRVRYRMLDLLRSWLDEGERSALVTLHDPALALNCCDRLLLLESGTVVGDLNPRCDTIEDMERQLGRIYGPVSLHRCCGRDGRQQLVMLKEGRE